MRLCAALALIVACACADPVLKARREGPLEGALSAPLQRLPQGLELHPEAQSCEDDTGCVVMRGLPGQRLENLCCATCDNRAAALNLDNAQLIAQWKKTLSCRQIACPTLGNCAQDPQPLGAVCQAGRCELMWP